jgi:alpha-tubulin suppressor-like RCC1 family protein
MRKDFLFVLSLLGIAVACRDEDQSPTAPDTSPELATTASTLVYSQVSVGVGHSCAVASDGRLFCWGRNGEGELGDGTRTDRLVPVPIGGALRFRQVSAGFFSTCAVTTSYRAYCWGDNRYGQLGDGTTTSRLSPAAVAGGHQFRRVETFWHTCAVTYPGGKAFCWGGNSVGELGIGNNTGPQQGRFGPFSPKPVAVLSSLTFRHVTVGNNHSCGATNDNRVFCWGYNKYGQVGDGSGGWLKLKPVRVAGTQQYRQVDAGQYHTCAVTTGNRAFCWGLNTFGALGNGTEHTSRRSPQAVSGGFSFDRVSAGDDLTCAETTGNRVYCWGLNIIGSIGDGTFTNRLTPVPVVGGLSFTQVSTGDDSCGISGGHAYCWGAGDQGYLGNGSTEDSPVPVPVSDPAGTS